MKPWTPLIAATLGWGASIAMTRAVLENGVDTFAMLPLRMTFAMLTLLTVIVTRRRFGTLDPAAWRKGAILGVVGMGVPMALMTLALEDLPVSISGLLIALIPITTIAAAHFVVDGERFQARSLPGLLVSLAGTGILVGVGGATIAGVDNLWRGVALVTTGVILAGVGGALSRRFALEVTGDALVLPQFTVATVILFAVMPFLGNGAVASWSTADWVLVALVGAVGTTLPFASFLVGATVNPASRLALTGYTVPIVAVLLAVIFLGEEITAAIVVGAVLIIGGVVLSERGTSHVPEPGVVTSR